MAKNRDITVMAETDADRSFVVGRNGTFPIAAVEVRSVGGFANIEGVGRRGRAIRGGITLTADAMDKLAHRWLRERVRR